MRILLLLSACLPFVTSFGLTSQSWFNKNCCRSIALSTQAQNDSINPPDVSGMLLESIAKDFQGDFDNYEQVVLDREDGKLPREGGGHEHIHCTLVPLGKPSERLAAFYFDGAPQRIFRFRFYELQPPSIVDLDSIKVTASTEDKQQMRMEMKLFTLNPQLEGMLRSESENPERWRGIFEMFVENNPSVSAVDILPNCEVSWSLEADPVQHSYLPKTSESPASERELHAVMVHGEAIVDSTMMAGIKIRVLDQLSLFPNVFYINDRGLDPETGAFIYGNQRNIPYQLKRVTKFVSDTESHQIDGKQRRTVVNPELEWTLGDAFRTDEIYEENMDAIGGVSAKLSAKGKT